MIANPSPTWLLIATPSSKTALFAQDFADRQSFLHADSLSAALVFLGARLPELVILDWNLPDGQGIDCLHKVHACRPDVPIVLWDDSCDDELALQAIRAGAQDVLPLGTMSGEHLRRSLLVAVERFRTTSVEDRTRELSQANAELAQANRLKDEFLANMSHELRTPLTCILGLTEILAERIHGPINDMQRQCLRHLADSGQHLLALINDILDVAKIGVGKVTLEPTTLNVAAVCQAVVQLIRPLAEAKQLNIATEIDTSVDSIVADPKRLKQMLVNLLSNAVKFTQPQGSIGLKLVADADNSAVHFTVWDTGIGISPDQLGWLFKPFVQLEAGLAREHGGAGLGLALVERLARLHDGSITVSSEVGRGSSFRLTLPWTGTALPGATCAKGACALVASETRTAISATVLVAEDSDDIADIVMTFLATLDCRPVRVRNGQMALEAIRGERPDLIITDLQMPGMHGLELIRQLRADPSLATVPIIILSGHLDSYCRRKYREAGVAECLGKPFTLKELRDAVTKHLPAGAEPVAFADLVQVPAHTTDNRPRILLAEDNEDVVDILREYLSVNGYHVDIARNGQEAWQRLLEGSPNLVLLDVQMPVMHGLDVLRRLRAHPTLAGSPVIVMTGLAMPGDKERCLEAGADVYLSKPFPLTDLMDVIRERLTGAGILN